MNSLAIIGAGNLGLAIAKGASNKGIFAPADIILTRRNLGKIESWKVSGYNLTNNNCEAVEHARIIVISVQPKQVAGLLAEIADRLDVNRHILVSVVTGVTTDEIHAGLGNKPVPVVRAMPNTAVAIAESMTCMCARHTTDEQLAEVKRLFDSLGKTLVVEERLMKAATVLAASGVAFFMRYLRAATQGGIQLGFDAEDAQAIAVQTAKGAATLLQLNGSHPEMEIDKVTTPEGCTIAGLNEMEHQGLSSALIKGILTSFEKINNIRK
ncbi:MAG: pyrroline-5-carboxylate reductase [Cyclobacteriaceae bacterium]|nr:pyrroline-5-carboxylate reductase [Cyclobacteriaceae bacterium]MCX7637876.1 pyrroline-5-carboxylate reductase [Cyclobacteriaceae bacterium]MDW8330493.1 pyrroline-5-carboxylate reductase [Cyclobacteriaceae bacterium]